jgi:hypothetical protein
MEVLSMPKAIPIISAFHNLSAGDLADHLGVVKAEIAALEDREKNLRHELIHRGVSECQGAAFSAQITEAVRWTLNTPTVKAEMGQAWWDARCRQSAIATVTVKPLATAAAPNRLAA